MYGPAIVARTISVPHVRDKQGNVWQYHSRSDYHSKVACWAIMFDLLQTSGLLRAHIAENKVVFGLNHEMRDFKTGRKKDLDLVVARPGTAEALPADAPRTLQGMAVDLHADLTQEEETVLSELPVLEDGPVGSVLLALEAKACMTEHVKARPRLHDELNSSHLAIHGASDQAIAAGFVMLNAATSFVSPDRNRWVLSQHAAEVTSHKQPNATMRVVEKVREIPRRKGPGEEGFDALGIVVVDCRNDGTPVSVVSQSPAPEPGDIFHYDQMVNRAAHVYDTRFASM